MWASSGSRPGRCSQRTAPGPGPRSSLPTPSPRLSSARKQRFHLGGNRLVYKVSGEDLVFCIFKRALVLLAEDERGEGGPLLLQELRRYTVNLMRRDLVLLPSYRGFPGLIKDAPLAVRRTQHHEAPVGDGEHGTHRKVELIGHPGCLVHYQQGDCREAS